MGSEAVLVRLGDVCTKIGSGATPRGGKEAYLGGLYSLIRSQNVYNHGFERDGIAHINEDQAAKLSNVEVKAADVLLNITGDSVARCCQVPDDVLPARVNQHVAIIRPDPNQLDPQYLRYYLVTPKIQSLLLSQSSAGATRPALTKGMIEDLEIILPTLPEQRRIAKILGDLDDKIELNRRMNETLEATARALFKSWFVDFDPVRAKIEGRVPEGVDAETAALFPDKLVHSELGMIPEGWEVGSLDEVAHFLNGLALQKYPPGNDYTLPVIKIAQLRRGDVIDADRCSAAVPPEYVVHDGDVLFSWSGSLEVDIWCGGDGALNQHLFKVTSSKYPRWYYYLWTLHHLDGFRFIASDKATTMGHIQRGHLTAAKVLLPPNPLFDSMTDKLSPLIDQLIINRTQSGSLGTIRTILLSKLMRGNPEVIDILKIKTS